MAVSRTIRVKISTWKELRRLGKAMTRPPAREPTIGDVIDLALGALVIQLKKPEANS